MNGPCDRCGGSLCDADVLSGFTVCSDCDIKAIKAAVAGISEWGIFVNALRLAAGADGVIHQRDVRRRVRGRMEPKHIGTAYRRAVSERLIERIGHEQSDDVAGKNAGRLEPLYRLRSAA